MDFEIKLCVYVRIDILGFRNYFFKNKNFLCVLYKYSWFDCFWFNRNGDEGVMFRNYLVILIENIG